MKNFNIGNLEPLKISVKDFLENFDEPILESYPNKNLKIGAKNNKRILKKPNEIGINALLFENMEHYRCVHFTPNGRLGRLQKIERRDSLGMCYDYFLIDIDPDNENHKESIANEIINYIQYISKSLPTFISRTKRGYHIYYKIDSECLPTPSLKDNSYTRAFDILCKKFRAYTDNGILDKAVSNISTLMRLPLTYYWKDYPKSTEKFFVDLVWYKPENIFNLNVFYKRVKKDIKERTDEEKEIDIIKTEYGFEEKEQELEDVVKIINDLPIENVVCALGYKISRDRSIIENEKRTDGWKINVSENYVNNFTASKEYRPKGGVFSFTKKHFNDDLGDAFEFFEQNYNIKTQKVVEVIKNSFYENQQNIISHPAIGKLKIEKKEKVMKIAINKDVYKEVANFYVELIGKVHYEGKDEIIIRLCSKNQRSRILTLPTQSSKSAFMQRIKQEGVFTIHYAAENLISLLWIYVEKNIQDLPELNLVNTIGFNNNDEFIAGNYIQRKDGSVYEIKDEEFLAGDNVIIVGNNAIKKSLEDILKVSRDCRGIKLRHNGHKALNKNSIKILMTQELPMLYNKDKIIPLFLGILNSIFSSFYREKKVKSGHVICWGQSESGKSSTIDFIKRLFKFENLDAKSAGNITPFALLSSCSSGIPLHATEYKADNHNREHFEKVMKETYDGIPVERGTAKLDVVKINTVSNFIVDGENVVVDGAVQTRSMIVFTHKEDKVKDKTETYEVKCSRIIDEYDTIIEYTIHNLLKYYKNNTEFYTTRDKSIEEFKKYYEKKYKLDINNDRLSSIYGGIYNLYKIIFSIPGDVEYDNFIKECLSVNLYSFLSQYKVFDSFSSNVAILFEIMYGAISKGKRDIIKSIFNLDRINKTLEVQSTMLKSSISSSAKEEKFTQAIESLSQMKVIESGLLTMNIPLTSPKLKEYKNSLIAIIRMLKSQGAIEDVSESDIEMLFLTAKDEIDNIL